MESLINNSKVIVCVGSGGVGKTTVAASLGVIAAKMGKKVLVLTIDPARRLAQSLGLSSNIVGDTRVPNQNFKGELYTGLIDADRVFDSFIKEAAQDAERLEKLLNNTLYKQLSTNLSGSQEFTSLDRLFRAVHSNIYDLVVLDTPPAQHAMDFLSAPEKIYALFQKSITKWFVQGTENNYFLSKVLSRGTQTVLAALERVTGSDFIGQLSEFFNSIQGIQDKISRRSLEVHELLRNEQTKFILVTAFDDVKLKEAKDIYYDLRKGGYHLAAIIVNRSFPLWLDSIDSGETEVHGKIFQLYSEIKQFYETRQKKYDEFQKELVNQLPIVRIPEMHEDVWGLESLEKLGVQIKKEYSQGDKDV